MMMTAREVRYKHLPMTCKPPKHMGLEVLVMKKRIYKRALQRQKESSLLTLMLGSAEVMMSKLPLHMGWKQLKHMELKKLMMRRQLLRAEVAQVDIRVEVMMQMQGHLCLILVQLGLVVGIMMMQMRMTRETVVLESTLLNKQTLPL